MRKNAIYFYGWLIFGLPFLIVFSTVLIITIWLCIVDEKLKRWQGKYDRF